MAVIGSEKRTALHSIYTKLSFANLLGILHVLLTIVQFHTAQGPKTNWSLKINMLALRLGNWLLILHSTQVEQLVEDSKIRWANPFELL